MSNNIIAVLLTTNDIVVGEEVSTVQVLTDSNPTAHPILAYPAILVTRREHSGPLGFMFKSWLPNELLDHTMVHIDKDHIITTIKLSPALESFYRNWALGEKEKDSAFKELFEKQILDLQEEYTKKRQTSRSHQQPGIGQGIPNHLIELFDELDGTWGDPTVTH